MGRNLTSELKVMAVSICRELPYSILSVSIYYGMQSGIRDKSYGNLNLTRASVFNFARLDPQSDIWLKSYHYFNLKAVFVSNFEHLNILWFAIRHPTQKIWELEFSRSFHVQFQPSRYIMVCNQTFKSKFTTVWICSELL